MDQAQIEDFRSLFNASLVELPLLDEAAANTVLVANEHQSYDDRIFNLVVTLLPSGINVSTLRQMEKHFYLEDVIDGKGGAIAEVLSNLCACIPGIRNADGSRIRSGPAHEIDTSQHVQAYIKSFTDEGWPEAIHIGRALTALRKYPSSNAQSIAVANAARRIQAKGYIFSVEQGKITLSQAEVERVTAQIERLFRQLGLVSALSNTIDQALRGHVHDFGQILFSRSYASGLGHRAPSYPIGFLFNLALKCPLRPPLITSNQQSVWLSALELARDFISILDVEPYSQYSFMGTDALRLEDMLRRVAHYDHCFTLRQWQLGLTPDFIEIFFGQTYDAELQRNLGWTTFDAILLAQALLAQAGPQSKIILADSLTMDGRLSRLKLHAMLPAFVHRPGSINRSYRSPFETESIDAIFKPLIMISRDHLLIPTSSTVGPAFFESVFSAVKSACGEDAIAGLRGKGTERLTKYVFAKHGLHCSHEDAVYRLKSLGDGECDFVFEDENDILFVESKAKPLTRGAMMGTQGDALLDFAGGIFEAQAQALQHERILRQRTAIDFIDGKRLEHRGRNITRLGVTLQDHGALQDRWIMNAIYNALLSAQVSCPPDYPRKDQVKKFNRFLAKFQRETQALAGLGQSVNAQSLSIASNSVSQLDILLEDVGSLSEVRSRLAMPITFGSYNALFDHHHMRRSRASNAS